jgi:hypothetical protein
LLTSAVEFQQSGDFIHSSYVVYLNHGRFKESLGEFLSRYPQMSQQVEAINEQLKPVQTKMQVLTKPISDYESL